jgi:hypothetical protein
MLYIILAIVSGIIIGAILAVVLINRYAMKELSKWFGW